MVRIAVALRARWVDRLALRSGYSEPPSTVIDSSILALFRLRQFKDETAKMRKLWTVMADSLRYGCPAANGLGC
jgi:hypothetical protein